MVILFLFINIIITYLIIPYMMHMLIEAKVLAKNYRGENIPIAMGITFVPVMLLNYFILLLFYREMYPILLIFLTATSIMAFVGLADDLMGDRKASGFKGHFYSIFRGRLTTGFLKAWIGGMISLIISLIHSNSISQLIINASIIALFTNLLNLLDLRPGRAIKAYLFLAFLFIVIGISGINQIVLFCIIGYCIGYLPQDIKAKSMMGDAGSNPLGISLGIISIISFSMTIKYFILLLLFLIHLVSEKYSLSQIIKNNSFLNYIDQLGRN